MRFSWLVLVAAGVPGCGLTLDYDPPYDGGVGGFDAPRVGCSSDLECADADRCQVERCVEGRCVIGETTDCDDMNVCNGSEACNPRTGACESTGSSLECTDDDNPCNGMEYCNPAVGCIAGPAPRCDDGIECTIDRCDLGIGACVNEVDDAACDAGPGGR
jgi:hypothetical protein